jgi:hypothetical protein
VTEDELLRLSFAQIHRLFEGYKLKDEAEWRKFRLIAYETWRKGARNAPEIDTYMPLGEIEGKEVTKEELDEIWHKYGKLDKKKKRKKLLRRVAART